jgi:hypothetical protein
MALFAMSGVLRGFPFAEYPVYASTKTRARNASQREVGWLVQSSSSKKLLIYELETYRVPNTCYVICRWTPDSFQFL